MGPEDTVECPSEERLASYAAGALGVHEAAAVRAHLDQCARCRQWLAEVEADDELLDDMRRMMGAEGQEGDSGSRPDSPNYQAGGTTSPDLIPSQPVEGYDILEKIGRGGMGVVYKAYQRSTKRVVALKVLPEGPLADQASRRRFKREVKVAASLKHPNIVTIHDSGLSQGQYYFVMDYIEGQHLDQYVTAQQAQQPSMEEPLRLMQQICPAVNYAHQRGVIHRDLKPSNILVDADGQPHILDFGLAKMVEPDVGAASSLISVAGQLIGTVPYMAPEQATGSSQEIDTLTDVYALGVIFYKLLTGDYPYPVDGERAEVLRNIAEAEPRRPRALNRKINDEVETIVLKALSKEKERRYQSAAHLGADIGRYLAGEAIEAKRDSRLYVLKKHLRRHWAAFGILATIVVLITVFAVRMSSLYRLAETRREQAEYQRQRADQKAGEATRAAEEARRAATEAVAERDRADRNALRLAEELQASKIERARTLAQAGNFTLAEDLLWIELLQAPQDLHAYWALWELYSQQPCLATSKLPGPSVGASVCFSPDGKTLAFGFLNGNIALWEVSSGRCLTTFEGGRGNVRFVAFSPDAQTLAAGHSNGKIELWDVSAGRRLTTFEGNGRLGRAACFSPDGKRLASTDGGIIKLWEVSSGRCLASLEGHGGMVWSMSFNTDGGTLASGSNDRTIKLWDVPSGRCLTTLNGHKEPVYSVAFSPDDRALASGSRDSTVKFWEVPSGQCLATLAGHGSSVYSVGFSLDGTTLVSVGNDNTINLWEISSGRCLTTLAFGGFLSHPPSVSFSPSGRMLASFSTGEHVSLWDVSPIGSLRTLEGQNRIVTSISFSPDGQTLAWASRRMALLEKTDTTVKLWGVSSGRHLGTYRKPGDADGSVFFSPSGDLLVWERYRDGKIKLWQVSSGQCLTTLSGHPRGPRSVVLSPDGKTIASGSSDTTIRLWETSSGRCLATLEGHSGAVTSVCFGPEGRIMASASRDGTIKLWEVPSGRCFVTLREHVDGVNSVFFAPNGKMLASGSDDATIKLWEVSSGRCLNTIHGHTSSVTSVCFGPQGRMMASASRDGTIKLWEIPSGWCLLTLEGSGEWINSLSFSPSGKMIASNSDQETAKLWDLTRYDQHILGNYQHQLARHSQSLGDRIDRQTLDHWADGLRRQMRDSPWPSPKPETYAEPTSGPTGVSPETIAAWGAWFAGLQTHTPSARREKEITAQLAQTTQRSVAGGISTSLRPLVEQARAALTTRRYANHGALVYRVRSADGKMEGARAESHYTWSKLSPFHPGTIGENEGIVLYEEDNQRVQLVFYAPGYHEIRRSVKFAKGLVTVWDDIVLQPVTTASACTVVGTVYLEDNAYSGGIPVTVRQDSPTAVTDASGNFSLSGVRSGKLYIRASKPGYTGLSAPVTTVKGGTSTCELRGYLQRGALVRWAYQQNRTRKLVGAEIRGGAAVLTPREDMKAVTFSSGLRRAGVQGDFRVLQHGKHLIIVSGQRSRAIELNNTPFSAVEEAPDVGYYRLYDPMRKGTVYVFKCNGSLRYAKMAVLDILDGQEEIREAQRALSLMATQSISDMSSDGANVLAYPIGLGEGYFFLVSTQSGVVWVDSSGHTDVFCRDAGYVRQYRDWTFIADRPLRSIHVFDPTAGLSRTVPVWEQVI